MSILIYTDSITALISSSGFWASIFLSFGSLAGSSLLLLGTEFIFEDECSKGWLFLSKSWLLGFGSWELETE